MVRRAAIVLGSVAAATLGTVLLAPIVARAVFLLFYAAVVISAAYAGVFGGIIAMVLSALVLGFYVVPRSPMFDLRIPNDAIMLVVFVGVSSLFIAVVMSMRSVRRRATVATADLEAANAHLANALDEANRARHEAMRQADRLRLLDKVSEILASSLDYETTIAATASLAVPTFADWCSVDILVGDKIKQLASKHIDTPGLRRMSEARSRHELSVNGDTGLAKVIRTGETQFVPDMTDEYLAKQARSPEHRAALLDLGIRSAITVPMIARGVIIGSLTMISTRADRPFDEGSLSLAGDIARRAAIAIDNAQLYHKAVSANEAKANFLATMSHELRTPLTAIIGYDELLAEEIAGEINDAQRQQLDRIKVSARQLLALIEEILLYARVEAGREEIIFAEVQAKQVVDDALRVVGPMAQTRQLTLTAEPIDPELTLETDAGKLRQMLINLIANAVKFTEKGRITVRAFADDADVVFEVQDTGIGIARENLQNIFEAFWQVEQSKSRKAGGSGLGLSTTRQLAKALGGDVSVKSEEQVGSSFRIVLPRQPAGVLAN